MNKDRVCPHCNTKFDNIDVRIFANHVRWCKCNPKLCEYKKNLANLHEKMRGTLPWNRGLTKDTDERVRKWTKTMHDKYESGELVGSFTGRHHSSETKDKLRIAALNSKHQRVCKKTFTYTKMNGDIVKMDSSYELIVAKILDAHCIEWTRPEPIPWIDSNGVMHNYFADFFIPTKNIYLDPKNEYCFHVQAVKIKCLSEQYNNIVFLHKDELTEDNILKLCE